MLIASPWRDSQPQAPEVRLEFSVPRVLRGDNRVPASPSEALEAIRRAYHSVAQQVGCHNRVMLGQQPCHRVPLLGGPDDSVYQQHDRVALAGRPVAHAVAVQDDLALG